MGRHILFGFWALLLTGCNIISASPDSSQTITVKAGASSSFTVTSSLYPLDTWIPGVQSEHVWLVDDIEAARYEGTQSTFVFAPQGTDIGTHKLVCRAIDFRTTPSIMTLWYGEVSWGMVVYGAVFSPNADVKIKAGTTRAFAATAYPTGLYAYTWYLDGTQIAQGQTISYTPDLTAVGPHTLEVQTAYNGDAYSYSAAITVSE